MRRAALLLLLALLLVGGGYGAGWTGDYRSRIVDGIHYVADVGGAGILTLFDAPLNTNGLTAADPAVSWPVTGVAAPDVAWWADDPTGSGGQTTHAFTASGSTTEVDTPFCPDGSHSDLSTGCMKARRFAGDGAEYTSNATTTAAPSGDFSHCTILKPYPIAAGSDRFVCKMESGGTGEGYYSYVQPARIINGVENHAGATGSTIFDLFDTTGNDWVISCYAYDESANHASYVNGQQDNLEATVASPVAPSGVALYIGNYCDGGTAADFTGDIAAFLYWDSYLSDTDMEALFEYFAGILDNEGAPVAYTSTGPNCCFVDGKIECFGDDWPMIGCELPPGVTGAGSPASGYYSGEALTNSAVGSRDLSAVSAYWTHVNAPGEGSADAGLFRDGRVTWWVEDSSAANAAYITQAIDITALGTADKIAVCLYARSFSGSSIVDGWAQENTVCAGPTSYELTNCSTTTAWTQCQMDITVTDGGCTNLDLRIYPAEKGDVANQGKNYIAVQVYLDQDWCPPIYIETEATAVGGGDDVLAYTVSGVPGIATWDGLTVYWDATFIMAAGMNGYEWKFAGTGTDPLVFYDTNEKHQFYGSAGATLLSSVRTNTPGTTYEMTLSVDYAADLYEFTEDGVSIGSDTDSLAAPTGVQTLHIGARDNGASQFNGWIDNVQVTQ